MGYVVTNIKKVSEISVGDTLTVKDVNGFAKGKLITLSTNLAVKLGIADKELDSFEKLLTYLNLVLGMYSRL